MSVFSLFRVPVFAFLMRFCRVLETSGFRTLVLRFQMSDVEG